MIPSKNQWTAYGVVAYEPKLMTLNKGVVAAKTVLITETAGVKVHLPVVAYNKKAHVLCAVAHKGSTIFAKGVFLSHTEVTSIQGKTLIGVDMKINEFEVMIREPVNVEDVDFVDIAAKYDPEFVIEEENENVK